LVERTDDYPSGEFEVIYPDGSCLACLGGSFQGVGGSFTSDPTLYTAVATLDPFGNPAPEGLVEFSVYGLKRSVVMSGAPSAPVWSSRGELALVRDGWIWAGSPGQLVRITRGSAPSWSPGGGRIVFVRKGWLMIGPVLDARSGA
jgi:hypothetical protein